MMQRSVSVLRLSTMWCFHKIHATMIKTLEELMMDPVYKIMIMGKRFNVSQWLIPNLNITQDKPLTLSEGNILGLEWVLNIGKL